MSLQAPEEVLSEALGVSGSQVLGLQRVAMDTRNWVWRCHVAGFGRPLYLKIQSCAQPSRSVSDEAEVLVTLAGAPFVPRIVAHGREPNLRAPYLITEAIEGMCLDEAGPTLSADAWGDLFVDILEVLDVLQDATQLRALLLRRIDRCFGPYRPDFDPFVALADLHESRHGAGAWASSLGTSSTRDQGSARAGVSLEVVHGSLAAFNILVEPANAVGAGGLVGILDFEGTRLGSRMIDVAMFVLDMLALPDGRSWIARTWLETCARHFGRARIASEVIPLIYYFYLSRLNTGATVPDEEMVRTALAGWLR